jgi:hypothetical protein
MATFLMCIAVLTLISASLLMRTNSNRTNKND